MTNGTRTGFHAIEVYQKSHTRTMDSISLAPNAFLGSDLATICKSSMIVDVAYNTNIAERMAEMSADPGR
jgi:hypothetical protein